MRPVPCLPGSCWPCECCRALFVGNDVLAVCFSDSASCIQLPTTRGFGEISASLLGLFIRNGTPPDGELPRGEGPALAEPITLWAALRKVLQWLGQEQTGLPLRVELVPSALVSGPLLPKKCNQCAPQSLHYRNPVELLQAGNLTVFTEDDRVSECSVESFYSGGVGEMFR